MTYDPDRIPPRDRDGAPLVWRELAAGAETTPPGCLRCGVELALFDYIEVREHPASKVPTLSNPRRTVALFRPRCFCWQLGTRHAVQAAAR